MSNIYFFSDPQIRPGVKSSLIVVAHDIVVERPDYVICGGDHWDMPSLSQYDKGKITFYTRRYIADIKAGNSAMDEFWQIINKGRKRYKNWKCKFIFLHGNHEDRINRAKLYSPIEFEGILDLYEPDLKAWDEVHEFLKIRTLNGVCFSHYICNEFTSKAISTANAILSKKHCSFVCGHKQTLDQAQQLKLDGNRIMGVIIGACYYHNEEYKQQNNHHFRGCLYMKNVKNGVWTSIVKPLNELDKLHGSKRI